MTDTRPTSRALLALELIQTRPGITADRLADALGVSDRAARRCVATLRDAGIPIESTRGPYGGYRVGRGVRLPPLMFSASEALGLVMAVLDGHHHAGDPADPVGSALGKLVRALPEPIAAQAETVRRTAAAAPDLGAARPDAQVTAELVQACAECRGCRIHYRSEAGTSWQTEVDPWAVVVRHGRWYLLCWSHRVAAQRAYRIDRISQVDPLAEQFERPVLPDPVAELEQHLGSGWEYSTEVVIDRPLDWVRARLSPVLGRVEQLDDERSRLVGSTSNPWWYAENLATLNATYSIRGGPELQRAAASIGERLVAAAGGGRQD